MKIKILYIALISFVFAACMPQSKYTPQQFETPEEFRIVHVSPTLAEEELTGDSLVYSIDSTRLAWQHYFQDKQLVSLINEGLENNFDVRQALKRMERYHLQFKQSKLELLPEISANIANPNYQWRSKDFYSGASDKWYGDNQAPNNLFLYRAQNISALNFSWEIDVWGKIRSQRDAELYTYLASVEAKNAIQTQLVADIASCYYNLLALYSQLEVAESNFDLAQRTLRMIELQYESGNTTALAKQQTKSQLLATKALIPKIKQEISEQENKLLFLTGKAPRDLELEGDTFDEVFQGVETNYSVPLSIVSYRTDVKQAEHNLWAANARVGVAQSNQYPKLSIDLEFGLNSLLPTNWFNIPGALFGSFIGNLTQPIFNKRKFKTQFEQAKLTREIKEIELQKTVYNAINEISNLLTLMNSLDEQIEIAEEQVTNSELTIFQSNLLFNSGYATYLEVINAQRVGLESEIHLNELKEKRLQLKVLLYKAFGGGW